MSSTIDLHNLFPQYETAIGYLGADSDDELVVTLTAKLQQPYVLALSINALYNTLQQARRLQGENAPEQDHLAPIRTLLAAAGIAEADVSSYAESDMVNGVPDTIYVVVNGKAVKLK